MQKEKEQKAHIAYKLKQFWAKKCQVETAFYGFADLTSNSLAQKKKLNLFHRGQNVVLLLTEGRRVNKYTIANALTCVFDLSLLELLYKVVYTYNILLTQNLFIRYKQCEHTQ